MTLVLLNALLPIFVALLLGYVAGRRGLMDNVNVRDLIVLVMNFAIPCAMFLTISKTTWPVLADQSETALMIAVVFVVSFTGSYIWARKSLRSRECQREPFRQPSLLRRSVCLTRSG
jgi:malonate transporter